MLHSWLAVHLGLFWKSLNLWLYLESVAQCSLNSGKSDVNGFELLPIVRASFSYCYEKHHQNGEGDRVWTMWRCHGCSVMKGHEYAGDQSQVLILQKQIFPLSFPLKRGSSRLGSEELFTRRYIPQLIEMQSCVPKEH